MNPRTGRRCVALVALAAAGAVSLPNSGARAQTAVDTGSSVLPLLVDEAILPLSLRESVLPLEDVQRRGSQTRVTLSADVLFAFNKATLTPTARRTIARIAKRLEGTVRVDGHTDSIGSDAYNLRLSRRRALAVVGVLRKASSGTRFSARGRGESSPVAPNTSGGKDDPAGRARNRRVTISYGRR